MRINKKYGHLQDWITQVWVKSTGRRYSPEIDYWLVGPIGDTEIIKDKFIQELATTENLEVKENIVNGGLLENFEDLNLTYLEKKLLNPRIVDFYEKTSEYNFEIWSEWCGFYKPFGWILSIIFSKRLQQLNLPLSSLQSAKGIKSNIIKLIDKSTKLTKWTIWYRILKSTNDVIYSGVYTTCEVPNLTGKFLKIVFPLPNGNIVVRWKKIW
jgi:hypothetical protein